MTSVFHVFVYPWFGIDIYGYLLVKFTFCRRGGKHGAGGAPVRSRRWGDVHLRWGFYLLQINEPWQAKDQDVEHGKGVFICYLQFIIYLWYDPHQNNSYDVWLRCLRPFNFKMVLMILIYLWRKPVSSLSMIDTWQDSELCLRGSLEIDAMCRCWWYLCFIWWKFMYMWRCCMSWTWEYLKFVGVTCTIHW